MNILFRITSLLTVRSMKLRYRVPTYRTISAVLSTDQPSIIIMTHVHQNFKLGLSRF